MGDQQWEHKDFVYPFQKGKAGWVGLGSGGYSVVGAKLEFWQDWQNSILPELQKWQDQGWEPSSEVGPGGIQIRTYRTLNHTSFVGWMVIILFSFTTFGLFIILAYFMSEYAEPVEFRVAMRRRK